MAPLLNVSVSHDTNQTLAEEAEAGQAAYIRMDLQMKHATPDSSLTLRPQITVQRFTVDRMSESEDESVLAAGSWNTRHSVFSAQASVAHQNTLNNVLVDEDLIGIDTRRRSKQAAFSWVHNQSRDRHQLTVGLNYSDVDYQGNDQYRFSGYRYPSLSITQAVSWSPRTWWLFTVYGSHLDSDSRTESDNAGAQIGFQHELTSRMTLSLSGGYSYQEVDRSFGRFTFTTRNTGYTGDLSLTRRDELGQWRLSAGRSVTAGGFGILVARSQAQFSFERRFAERWTANVSLRHVGNEDVSNVKSGEVHSFQRFDGGLQWRLTRTWTLGASAFVNRLQRGEDSPLAEGWGAILSATWVPKARTLSR